jgi:hypothetical protein
MIKLFNRSNVLFDIAKAKTKELQEVIDEKPALIQNKFLKIIPDNPKSPMIMGMGDYRHLIYYPADSVPYLHQYETAIKFIEILDGELFDELTGRRYEAGDTLTIYPGEEVKPYTKNQEAYVKVTSSIPDSVSTKNQSLKI